MALLGACLYDPAVAVSKSTATLLAMTALDTTNLRLAFTVPSNGAVMVRLQGTVQANTTTPVMPQILLGVLEGSTVKARVAPAGLPNGLVNLATTLMTVEAVFVVPGLTPAANLTWDAAYAVETIASGGTAGALKYGGPNTAASANDAFGAFLFEIWSTG